MTLEVLIELDDAHHMLRLLVHLGRSIHKSRLEEEGAGSFFRQPTHTPVSPSNVRFLVARAKRGRVVENEYEKANCRHGRHGRHGHPRSEEET